MHTAHITLVQRNEQLKASQRGRLAARLVIFLGVARGDAHRMVRALA